MALQVAVWERAVEWVEQLLHMGAAVEGSLGDGAPLRLAISGWSFCCWWRCCWIGVQLLRVRRGMAVLLHRDKQCLAELALNRGARREDLVGEWLASLVSCLNSRNQTMAELLLGRSKRRDMQWGASVASGVALLEQK